jgi:hypothetical protein
MQEKQGEAQQAPIDFFTFVLGLASSVFVHLGDAPHPETGVPGKPELGLARQTIEILDMLREKTKGNLTEEESTFLENLLTDLRLRFVARSSGK